MRASITAPAGRTDRSISRALRALAAAAAVALLSGCMMFARPPRDLDYSRTRASEGGRYRATIRPQGDSIPQGRLQRWTLHLETATGIRDRAILEMQSPSSCCLLQHRRRFVVVDPLTTLSYSDFRERY